MYPGDPNYWQNGSKAMWDEFIAIGPWPWVALAVIGLIYFIPAIVAFSRGAASRWGVAFLNAILGWTLFAWVVAFVWACVGRRRHD